MNVMAKKKPTPVWTPARIRELRSSLGLTQAAAAEKVGVTRRQWAAWEAGESRPSGPALVLLQLLKDGKI